MSDRHPSRRALLQAITTGVAGGVAGCSGGSTDTAQPDGEQSTTTALNTLSKDQAQNIKTSAADRVTVYEKFATFYSRDARLEDMTSQSLPDWLDLLPSPSVLKAFQEAQTVLQNSRDLNLFETLGVGSRTFSDDKQVSEEAAIASQYHRQLADAARAVSDAAAAYLNDPSAQSISTLRDALTREYTLLTDQDKLGEIDEWRSIDPGVYGGVTGSADAARYIKHIASANYQTLRAYRQTVERHRSRLPAPVSQRTTTSQSSETSTPTPEQAVDTLGLSSKLVPTDSSGRTLFGQSVALSGDGTTALIGAYGDNEPNGDGAGSAYVFTQRGGSWTQHAKLAPTDGDSLDRFGWSVALSGDGTTALIGAWGDEDPNGKGAGSAYVFTQRGGSWTQHAKLAPTDGSSSRFGWSVALAGDGTTGIIGTRGGSVHVFTQRDGAWTQQAKLDPTDGSSRFNWTVALARDGTTALIGAPEGAGSAYVFSASGDAWTQQSKLAATDGDSGDSFGSSVALAGDGTTALIAAPYDEDPNGAGSAYVFSASGGAWTQQTKIGPSDGDSGDHFGTAVTLAGDGTTALIGAPDDEDPNGPSAGSAYVFTQRGGSWTQHAKLAPADVDPYQGFGQSVALARDGTSALIGDPGDAPSGLKKGAAYVFKGG